MQNVLLVNYINLQIHKIYHYTNLVHLYLKVLPSRQQLFLVSLALQELPKYSR